MLCPLLQANEVLLDLHSFNSAGRPFAMLGPRNNSGTLEPFAQAELEERMVTHLGPARVVEGWLDTYARGVQRRRDRGVTAPLQTDWAYGVGTTEFMRAQGGCSVTLECGQHVDPDAPAVAYRAITQTLALLGMTDSVALQPPAGQYQVLQLVDVTDRFDVGDRFVRDWRSFDEVAAGELIGVRHDGTPVKAEEDGFVVFPNTGALVGNEWFYFAKLSDRRLAM